MMYPVIVTGSATRIGKAIAKRLAARGYPIILHYRRSEREAIELAEYLNAEVVYADLSDSKSVQAMVVELSDRKIGGIVNNASSFIGNSPTERLASDWNELFGSNARGPFFLTVGLIGSVVDGGSIVNITDIHADIPLKGFAAYSMAKAALSQMTRSLAKEFAPRVRVNAVAPGAILWPEKESSEEFKRTVLTAIPLRRLGTAEDISRTVQFLFESPYITGETIRVDGGRSL